MTTTYTGVNGGTFPNTIVGPADGEVVTGASVGLTSQGAANECKFLYDTKVDRAGDTMTGTLDVTGTASTGNAGIQATGDGTGPGLAAEGGAGSGTGVLATGGVTNGIGLDATGRGTGAGILASGGATGKGIVCDGGGGAVALEVSTGHAAFTGTQPAKTANPGTNNLLCGTNVAKAWGWINSDGIGGVTNEDGYNIASVSISGGDVQVTFARAMANEKYAVLLTEDQFAAQTKVWKFTAGSKLTTGFKINAYSIGDASTYLFSSEDFAAEELGVSFGVFARQA